jgi:predicted NBD/HSP70 family sugar kinase/biotin operon repressor
MRPWHLHTLDGQQQREKKFEGKNRKGSDQRHIRESNRVLILNYIRKQKTLPRSELARYTGLSRTAIGNIVDELIQEGIVLQEDRRTGDDRRTMLLSFNARAGYVLGGTLGRQHLTVLLADLIGTPLQRLDIPFSTIDGPEEGLPHLAQALKAFIAKQQIEWKEIVGIGLGIVGPLDPLLQSTTAPTPFSGWAGVTIQPALEKALGLPVYLDNDGNMGALGESRYGAGRNERDVIYVKVGSGIAGGLILNDQLYRGCAGTAGEIGHIPVDFNGMLCHCGRYGCLETVAGKQGILLEAQRSSPTMTTMTQVIEAAREGDDGCIHALERAGNYLGFALAGLVNSLNPCLIVLDGSTLQAGDLVLHPLQKTLEAHSLQAPFTHTRVTLAEQSGLAMPFGGVATVLDAVFHTT